MQNKERVVRAKVLQFPVKSPAEFPMIAKAAAICMMYGIVLLVVNRGGRDA